MKTPKLQKVFQNTWGDIEELTQEELLAVVGGQTSFGEIAFQAGKEYVYDFALDSHAGSSDYIPFSEVFKLTDEKLT